MPLRDHFHPPLSAERHWESFHALWATTIADALNETLLPQSYFAEVHVHGGSRVEIDVATFDSSPGAFDGNDSRDEGGIAIAPIRAWAPPAPDLSMPAIFPDSLEVFVFNSEGGPTLVAAVELVSPGNKDRQEYRRAFAPKCSNYLQQGIGLVIVDIVTDRRANLHYELVNLLGVGGEFMLPADDLYAVAYRPIRRPHVEQIDIWRAPLTIGDRLPLLPLALDKQVCVPLDLETTYRQACRMGRLPG
ncbi:MAG TPA: DUF4058 family protein [Tepidisphaeraceae bacterium]|jgi:hypothetical protein|nr:DUF4058 family protein [Tepidisphaeraceae bacterium]